MWDKEGSGFFCVKGLRDGTKYIHLGYGIIIAEDTVKVSIQVRKNGEVYLELRN